MAKKEDFSLCVWADLKNQHIDLLKETKNSTELEELLSDLLQISNSTNSKILLDLYLGAYKHACSKNFGNAQTSTFISIIKRVHEMCVSTPFGNFDECCKYFRKLLPMHAVHRPPWSLKIFNTKECQIVNDYITDVYFRHFKMYKFSFTARLRLDLQFTYKGLPEEVVLEEGSCVSQDDVTNEEEVEEVDIDALDCENELEMIIKKAVQDQLRMINLEVEEQLDNVDKAVNNKLQELNKCSSEVNGVSGKKSKRMKKINEK